MADVTLWHSDSLGIMRALLGLLASILATFPWPPLFFVKHALRAAKSASSLH